MSRSVNESIKHENKQQVFNTLWGVLLGVFVIFLFTRRLAPLEFAVANRYIPLLLLMAGAVLIVWDFVSFHRVLSAPRVLWILGFVLWSTLSVALFVTSSRSVSLSPLLYTVMCACLIYGVMADRTVEENTTTVLRLGTLYLVLQSLVAIATLVVFLLDIEFAYVIPGTDRVVEQGYQSQYGRAWGFYYEANFLGIASVICVWIAAALAIRAWKKGSSEGASNGSWRHRAAAIGWVIFGVLNLVIWALSGSRSAMVALYVPLALAAGFSVWIIAPRIRISHTITQVGACVLAGLAAIAVASGFHFTVMHTLVPLQRATLSTIDESARDRVIDAIEGAYGRNGFDVQITTNPERLYLLSHGNLGRYSGDMAILDEADMSEGVLVRQDVESIDDSNLRFTYWKMTADVVKQHPIVGVGSRNITTYALEHGIPVSDEAVPGNTVLDAYLEVVGSSGLVGFLLYACFLVPLLWTGLAQLRRRKNDAARLIFPACMIASYMIFVVFLSDVFVDFTINTLFFWLSLGLFVSTVSHVQRQSAQVRDGLFIADTPVQILNALTLAMQEKSEGARTLDVAILDQFEGAQALAQRLENEHVFSNVWVFTPRRTRVGARLGWVSRILRPVATLWIYYHPQATLRRHAHNESALGKLSDRRYRTLYLSFFTHFSDTFRALYSDASVVLFEDGLGTYTTPHLASRYRSSLFHWYVHYVMNDRIGYPIQRAYVWQPRLMTYEPSYPVVAMPDLREHTRTLQRVKRVFAYAPSPEYHEHRFIYLTQPLSEKNPRWDKEKEAELLDVLTRIVGDDLLIRVHPRQNKDFYRRYGEIDEGGNSWELQSLDGLRDDQVLISAFSSAQVMAHVLSHQDITQIFFYPIVGGDWAGVHTLIERLEDSYDDPTRIHTVTSLADLEHHLEDLQDEPDAASTDVDRMKDHCE
ncbi:MAG: O-antigen ligase family protein [Actinomycetaceae bacterium]|nr:O-antigen ligase family protein [Actinomycetaceae bacterium]MDY6083622.1 O-antigen ligase family protein [Actinomycetaceae bacterium]